MRASQQSAAASSKQKDQQPLPAGKALVKAVPSGDSICLVPIGGKKLKSGEDPFCFLAYLSVPRIGTPNRTEEAYAFDAREAIREKLIGQKVDYVTEYMAGSKKAVSVKFGGEDVATLLVKASLAKVNERRGNTTEGGLHEQLLAVQEEVSQKGKGVWNADNNVRDRNTRQVTYFGEADYSASRILAESQKEPRPLGSILEHVFGTTMIATYVMRLKTQVKMNLVHLYTPRDTDQAIYDEGKAFIEKMLLHRTVGIKLTRVDENNGNLIGRLHFPQGDIASEILKRGLAKLSTPKDSDFDADYFRELKQAQLIGQSKRAGLWKDMDESEIAGNRSNINDFVGRVVEVHSGDSLTVERESDHNQVRVFLSSVKAPALNNRPPAANNQGSGAAAAQNQPQNDSEPYAWESKESLRKLAIGKKVRVEMEYDRVVPTRTGGQMTMNFGAVTDAQKNKNLAVVQLERGLIRTNIRQSGDNASKYLEDLLAGEKKAATAKLCLHNASKQPPMTIFADLSQNTKQAKEFENMVLKRKDRTFRGVVEYCFSGMKFKIRLEQEGRMIAINLLGVRTMAQDKNQPTLLEYANDALRLAKANLYQRDVTIELFFADKRGTFFGNVQMPNRSDFAVKLCEEGLAQTHLQGNNASQRPVLFQQMQEAENSAKQKSIGIWGSQLNLQAQGESGANSRFDYLQRIRVEMTDMKDAYSFHVRRTDGNSQHQRIDDAMAEFDAESSGELERPIMRGTRCAALFSADDLWYRVKVVSTAGRGEITVKFIDYGNTEVVSEATLRKLPAHLLSYEPQAMEAQLAFLRVPRIDNTMGQQAGKYVQKHGLNQVHDAIVCESEVNQPLQLILMEEGEEDWSSSLNAYMLAEGLAILPSYVRQRDASDQVPEQVQAWTEFEDEARANSIALWQHGNAAGALDEEDY